MNDGPRTRIIEHRLSPADIQTLSLLVGQSPRILGCSVLYAETDADEMVAPSVTLEINPGIGKWTEWIEITTRGESIDPSYPLYFFLPVATRTSQPVSFAVTQSADASLRTIAPHSHVHLKNWGAISTVEILSFSRTHDDVVEDDGTAVTEMLVYDRGVRLRFTAGRTLCLSTQSPNEYGHPSLEIRPADSLWPSYADEEVVTRLTLDRPFPAIGS
jgi:hypothetical protein